MFQLLISIQIFQIIITASSKMQSLRRQNNELNKVNTSYQQEIQKQKEINAQHEVQIQTLIKFNQRLLAIIQTEVNNKKDNCSLSPISERSQRQSDLISNSMHNFVKARNLGAKSQRGKNTTNSLVEKVHPPAKKLDFLGRDVQKSLINNSISLDKDSEKGEAFKQQESKQTKDSNQIKQEMSRQIRQLNKFKNESTKFYDSKIKQIRNLSNKISTYHPMDQINQITNKLTLSPNTSDMIKRAILRSTH